jgi:hypothetical protein
MLAILQCLGVSTIQPDYKQNIHLTFASFLGGLLEWDPLSVSMICHSRGADIKNRSWVPNWAGPMVSPWLLGTDLVGNTKGATSFHTKKPMAKLAKDGGLLMTAMDCGSIVFRSRSMSVGDFRSEEAENCHGSFSQLVKEVYGWWKYIKLHCTREYPYDHFYPSLFAALEGISRIRRVDKIKSPFIPPESPYAFPYDYCSLKGDYEDFEKFFDILREQLRQLVPNRYAIDSDTGLDHSTWSVITGKLMAHERASRYAGRLAYALMRDQRCLFVLSNGYFGTGLEDLRLGDRIFLLDGVHVPMALRPVGGDNKYRVVGAVLVQGLMNWDDIRIDRGFTEVRLV